LLAIVAHGGEPSTGEGHTGSDALVMAKPVGAVRLIEPSDWVAGDSLHSVSVKETALAVVTLWGLRSAE
jgi:hypothetical protein